MYDSSQVPAATVIYRRETDLNKVAEVSQDDAYLLDHAGVTAGHLYYDAAFIYEYHDGTFWTSDGSVECWGTLEECESLLADGEYILGGERRAAL